MEVIFIFLGILLATVCFNFGLNRLHEDIMLNFLYQYTRFYHFIIHSYILSNLR